MYKIIKIVSLIVIKCAMNNYYTTLILLFTIQVSFGQIGFEENVITESLVSSVTDMHVADLDGDGDKDLLVSSEGNDKVSWFENVNGNYSIQSDFFEDIIGAKSVYAEDMDNDGDIDALVAFSNTISWFENIDGQGNFSASQEISSEMLGAIYVFSSDIDGDGDQDVVSASGIDRKLTWYENMDGQGDFGPQQIIVDDNGVITEMYARDIDNDGDNDIVYGRSIGNVTLGWLENIDGQGSFVDHTLFTTISVESLFVEDVDGDSDLDIVAHVLGTVSWFENLDGQGDFSSELFIASTPNAFSIYVSDIDGDSDNDIVSIVSSPNRIVWYENLNGLGNFGEEQIITFEIENGFLAQVADLNDDGYNDIVSASYNDDKIAWYENTNGLGDFGNQQVVSDSEVSSPGSVFPIDIDGDGDNDILFSAFADHQIGWYENIDNLGNFGLPIIISSDLTASAITSGDMDNDGDMDIVYVEGIDQNLVWLENTDGQGTFGANQIISQNVSVFDNASPLFISDFDNDGDNDILLACANNVGDISWFENLNGEGAFSNKQIISTQVDFPNNVYADDIDGDGDLDVISSSKADNKIAWYENLDGIGGFGGQNIISTMTQAPTSVYAKDIDGDGDLDVLSASEVDDKIAWYENITGQGDFGEQNIISSLADRARSVYSIDIDNDGDNDVFSASLWDNKIAWYENLDGQGAFGDQQIISNTIYSPQLVYATDMNGDNKFDLISYSSTNDKIVWYENLGLNSNAISGVVSLDLEANDCNSGEFSVENIMITTTDGINNFSTITNANGFYKLYPAEGNYETSIVFQTPNFSSTPASYNSNFSGIENSDIANFCISSNLVSNNLNISVYPFIDDPRPGFDTSYKIVYSNIGTTQIDGTVIFDFDDSKLQFLSASETVVSQTSNSLTFDYHDLNPFETKTIDLEFNVFAPPITNIDDVLVSNATINPVSGDETENDNTFTLEQTVIGSYDPNDITCLEGAQILIEDVDKYLHYLIRFQNTGTARASNIRIENLLDDKLDWTTMQLERLSHNGRVEILNGSDVSFIFDNINLVDSTNDESNSHGFIAYKIKPKDNVILGDIFYNTADIYFDFNPPIITNTAATEIVDDLLSVSEYGSDLFTAFPNPTNSKLTIKSKLSINEISIVDINGRLLNKFNVSNENHDITLDVDDLSNGIYFLKIQTDNKEQTIRFIKN